MDEEERGSEYGKGLVICLVKFAEHFMRWPSDKAMWERIQKQNPDHPDWYGESHAVEMWFSGAADHLFEIEVPERFKGTEIEAAVITLQSFGLARSLNMTGETLTEGDILTAGDLCREIALAIDRDLGLEPELGRW